DPTVFRRAVSVVSAVARMAARLGPPARRRDRVPVVRAEDIGNLPRHERQGTRLRRTPGAVGEPLSRIGALRVARTDTDSGPYAIRVARAHGIAAYMALTAARRLRNDVGIGDTQDRKSTRLNSSHLGIS